MNINEIRMTAANAGSSPINISGSDLLTILNSIPAPASGSQWDDVTGGINYADGNVGINNAAPTVALDVVGSAKIRIPFGSELFDVDAATGFISIGDLLGDFGNSFIRIDQSTLFKIQCKNTPILIGDDGTGNDTKIILEDNIKQVQFQGLHFNYIGLQDFANNAAAITGGLSTGDLYYTNSGGSAVLKIVV